MNTSTSSATQLNPETERRLDLLVSETGRSKAFYRHELTKRSLEDIEDYYLSLAVLERVHQEKEKSHSAADCKNSLRASSPESVSYPALRA